MMMIVIPRLSSAQCKEIRKQAVHNVRPCQRVAMQYNLHTKTLRFRKTCHRHKGAHAS